MLGPVWVRVVYSLRPVLYNVRKATVTQYPYISKFNLLLASSCGTNLIKHWNFTARAGLFLGKKASYFSTLWSRIGRARPMKAKAWSRILKNKYWSWGLHADLLACWQVRNLRFNGFVVHVSNKPSFSEKQVYKNSYWQALWCEERLSPNQFRILAR